MKAVVYFIFLPKHWSNSKYIPALFHANIENIILKKKFNLKKDLKLTMSHFSMFVKGTH